MLRKPGPIQTNASPISPISWKRPPVEDQPERRPSTCCEDVLSIQYNQFKIIINASTELEQNHMFWDYRGVPTELFWRKQIVVNLLEYRESG